MTQSTTIHSVWLYFTLYKSQRVKVNILYPPLSLPNWVREQPALGLASHYLVIWRLKMRNWIVEIFLFWKTEAADCSTAVICRLTLRQECKYTHVCPDSEQNVRLSDCLFLTGGWLEDDKLTQTEERRLTGWRLSQTVPVYPPYLSISCCLEISTKQQSSHW